MSISRDEVRRIARLAHLEFPRVQDDQGRWSEPETMCLDDEALDRLAAELGRILDHVRDLQAVDVEGVPPTRHGVELPSRWRSDEAKPSIDRDAGLSGAPARIGDAVAVPKIVE